MIIKGGIYGLQAQAKKKGFQGGQEKEMISPFSRPPEEPEFIKAICVIPDLFSVGDDVWPSLFRMEPRVGDYVESNLGRRLRVNDVIHKMIDFEPQIELELGRSSVSDVTPSEGGAFGVEMEPE